MNDDSDSGAEAITIVIADDHEVVRAGLKMLLDAEQDFKVVSEAGDVAVTERRVAAYRPRVHVVEFQASKRATPPPLRRDIATPVTVPHEHRTRHRC